MAKLAYSYSHDSRYNTVLISELDSECTVFLQGDDSQTFLDAVRDNKSRQTNKLINLVCGEYFPNGFERNGNACCSEHANYFSVVEEALAKYI